jgi:hypothetical protein
LCHDLRRSKPTSRPLSPIRSPIHLLHVRMLIYDPQSTFYTYADIHVNIDVETFSYILSSRIRQLVCSPSWCVGWLQHAPHGTSAAACSSVCGCAFHMSTPSDLTTSVCVFMLNSAGACPLPRPPAHVRERSTPGPRGRTVANLKLGGRWVDGGSSHTQ